ncbi:hypothetical protein Tco_1050335, partial [Tanacetum coccineum]
MCDKKNSVLFTDTKCLIMSPSFKLLDESQVVLRAPRQNDVYSLDLKKIVPSGGLENQLNHKVKIIRCDHGTEFKNHAMNKSVATFAGRTSMDMRMDGSCAGSFSHIWS